MEEIIIEKSRHYVLEEVGDKLAQEEPGTIIPHFVLLKELGYDKQNSTYYNAVDRLRTYLRNTYGLFLSTESRQGYKLLRHGQEDVYIDQRLRDGMFRVRKANTAAEGIRLEGLENGDLVRISKLKGKLSSIALFIKQS